MWRAHVDVAYAKVVIGGGYEADGTARKWPKSENPAGIHAANVTWERFNPTTVRQGNLSEWADHFPTLLVVDQALSLIAGAGAARHSTREKSFSTGIGTETTLGLPKAVEIRIALDMNRMVVVNRLLTTATTRPEQSTTGAPEAP